MSLADLARYLEPLDWQKHAACRDLDSEYFFWGHGTHGGGTPDAVKRVAFDTCKRCPVQPECLDYAVTMVEPAGIWGGLTPRQRRKLRRQREAA
jgi:WhiB family transcriptional regulator, redox-sensing transcriptional regulator